MESIGDDDDKALLMSLILIRLVEHRRAQGPFGNLKHLLVIEEAHRLLSSAPSRTREEEANPRGQAVEMFTNLLSEVRAYGQGILVADQVPVRLAADVVKNTGLKVAHRIVAGDDQMVLGATMAMDETQSRALTTLETGCAAIFREGDDLPIMVAVTAVKQSKNIASDADIQERMRLWRGQAFPKDPLLARPFCVDTCSQHPDACQWARQVVDDSVVTAAFSRTVLSMLEEPAALDRLWDDLLAVLSARRTPGLDEVA
jgi:hypothetical protein